MLGTHEIASRIKAASHADVNRPQWLPFLPDWTTAQTGKGGGAAQKSTQRTQVKENRIQLSGVTTKANTGEEQRRHAGGAKHLFGESSEDSVHGNH